MKYLLISKETGEQTICDKVTIDGFDYYVSDMNSKRGWFYCYRTKSLFKDEGVDINCCNADVKVIATNNPNINIPQVVDEAEMSWRKFLKERSLKENSIAFSPFIIGYNKSKETHSFSEEDLIEFNEWCETSAEANLFWRRNRIELDMSGKHHEIIKQKRKELLQLWKSQQPKKVYYNLLFNTK